uniref:Uncharacterized protein n=1 Tax=Helianthus annuus TaxID=4232 RepID=A0A251U192_HELAN
MLATSYKQVPDTRHHAYNCTHTIPSHVPLAICLPYNTQSKPPHHSILPNLYVTKLPSCFINKYLGYHSLAKSVVDLFRVKFQTETDHRSLTATHHLFTTLTTM